MIGLWKVGFCSFTCGPYQFASDEGICCKLATIAAAGGSWPVGRIQHMKCLFAEPCWPACQSSSPVFSVMMFVNRMVQPRRIGSQSVERESCPKTEMRADLGAETGSQLPTPLRWHLWLLRDFWEYLALYCTNPIWFFPQISFKCRQTVIVFTVSLTGNQAAFQLFAQNIHWLNWILEFQNQLGRTRLPRIVWENKSWYLADDKVLDEQLFKLRTFLINAQRSLCQFWW